MTKRIDESNAGGIRAALDILSQSVDEAAPDEFDYGFDPEAEFDDGDDRVEAFHRGFDAFFAKEERPTDADEASGWDYAESASLTQTVTPERPEGYYHMPLGTFESLDEVRQAGEYDFRKNMTSRKGGVYTGPTSLPGKAASKVRYTQARSGDNALSETKGFIDYLKEVEESAPAEKYPDTEEGAKQALVDVSIYSMEDIVSAEPDNGGVWNDPTPGAWLLVTDNAEHGKQSHVVYLRGPMAGGPFGADFETLD